MRLVMDFRSFCFFIFDFAFASLWFDVLVFDTIILRILVCFYLFGRSDKYYLL